MITNQLKRDRLIAYAINYAMPGSNANADNVHKFTQETILGCMRRLALDVPTHSTKRHDVMVMEALNYVTAHHRSIARDETLPVFLTQAELKEVEALINRDHRISSETDGKVLRAARRAITMSIVS